MAVGQSNESLLPRNESHIQVSPFNEYAIPSLTQESYEQENQSTKYCCLIRWKTVSIFLFVLWIVTSAGFAVNYFHMHGQLSQARTHHGNGEFDTRVDSHIGGFATQQQSQISADTLVKRIKETSPCLPPSCTECATRIKAAPSDGYEPEYRQCASERNLAVVNITCFTCDGKCTTLSREKVRSLMDNITPVLCPPWNVTATISHCDVMLLCQLHNICNGEMCVDLSRTTNVTCSCPAGRTGKYCTETAEKIKVKCKCFHSTLSFCSDDLPSCDVVSHGDPNNTACKMTGNATSQCLCDTSRQIDDSSSMGTCSSMQVGVFNRLTSGAGIYKASVSLTAGLTNMYLMVFWLTHGLRTDI